MNKRLPKSLLDQRFERWNVIKDTFERKVLCLCDCSTKKWIDRYTLLTDKSKSCGCLNKEVASKRKIHGDSINGQKSRLYRIWTGMKARCNNENSSYYHNYGGRGIKVCNEWSKSYQVFKEWALNNGYSENLTIDRRNNNGNYEASNCRWVTKQEQDVNKRNNIFFYVNGEKVTMKELSRLTGIPDNTLHYRYHRHKKITYEEIIKPMRKRCQLKDN